MSSFRTALRTNYLTLTDRDYLWRTSRTGKLIQHDPQKGWQRYESGSWVSANKIPLYYDFPSSDGQTFIRVGEKSLYMWCILCQEEHRNFGQFGEFMLYKCPKVDGEIGFEIR